MKRRWSGDRSTFGLLATRRAISGVSPSCTCEFDVCWYCTLSRISSGFRPSACATAWSRHTLAASIAPCRAPSPCPKPNGSPPDSALATAARPVVSPRLSISDFSIASAPALSVAFDWPASKNARARPESEPLTPRSAIVCVKLFFDSASKRSAAFVGLSDFSSSQNLERSPERRAVVHTLRRLEGPHGIVRRRRPGHSELRFTRRRCKRIAEKFRFHVPPRQCAHMVLAGGLGNRTDRRIPVANARALRRRLIVTISTYRIHRCTPRLQSTVVPPIHVQII